MALALALTAPLGAPVRAAGAQERESAPQERALSETPTEGLEAIASQLEGGVDALRALGREKDAEHLLAIAREVRAAVDARDARAHEASERGSARLWAQWKALGLARKVLARTEHADALDLVERGMRARELRAQGRRDEEARRILERAPGAEQEIELLSLAEALYREQGDEERAATVSRLTEELWGGEEKDAQRERERGRQDVRRELDELERRLDELARALDRLAERIGEAR